jgi:hypothetical protein
MIEARMLDLPDFSDRRGGALIGVYRHVGEHVKVGVGYNFTDFSEDLTDLSFRHQGVFMNVVGSMWSIEMNTSCSNRKKSTRCLTPTGRGDDTRVSMFRIDSGAAC